jgi:hypothetical protein
LQRSDTRAASLTRPWLIPNRALLIMERYENRSPRFASPGSAGSYPWPLNISWGVRTDGHHHFLPPWVHATEYSVPPGRSCSMAPVGAFSTSCCYLNVMLSAHHFQEPACHGPWPMHRASGPKVLLVSKTVRDPRLHGQPGRTVSLGFRRQARLPRQVLQSNTA